MIRLRRNRVLNHKVLIVIANSPSDTKTCTLLNSNFTVVVACVRYQGCATQPLVLSI
jgi:hypothetical protein